MLKMGMKEYIYHLLDKLSDQYKTELKKAKFEAEVREKIGLLTMQHDSKEKK